jgi:2-keto-3-deoxy-L-fuconate dehydrogenase
VGALSPFRLDAKTAIVTGGGSGIGRSIAETFARNGAHIRILDIDLDQANESVKRIVETGGDALAFQCELSNQQAVNAIIDHLTKKERIHILVNNAGVSHIGNLESTTEEDFDRIYRINIKGFYNCMRAVIKHMKTEGGGIILNMASVAGSAGLTDRFAYSMSKGGVLAMTYSVAKDYLSHNIRCNCISPARVHTPFVDDFIQKNYAGREQEMFVKLSQAQPIGRMAQPREVADLALFLCSDEAAFITGCDYPMDGGFCNLRG